MVIKFGERIDSNNVFFAIPESRQAALKPIPSLRAWSTFAIRLMGFFIFSINVPFVSEKTFRQLLHS
ncbi:hypothetical protein CCP3SC1_200028 [Gammaproteobacteria bacterium]